MSQLPRPSVPSISGETGVGIREDGLDPDLLSLPDPPRRERNLTVAVLAVTVVVSILMCAGLSRDAAYAFASGSANELGDLNHTAPTGFAANTLVRGQGLVGAAGGIRYERPFEPDSYRLVPVAGRSDLWVEIRVPSGQESGRYVPPSAFEGRLVPFDSAGLRHRGLASVARETSSDTVPSGAWLIVDGETPSRSRWAVMLVTLFLGFAAWNLLGIMRLLRRVT